MEFAYSAIDSSGNTVKDVVKSDSETQAVQRLQSQGYIVLEMKAARGRAERTTGGTAGKTWNVSFRRKVKLDKMVLLTREFAIMIETGVPIVEAVQLLRNHAEDPMMQEALEGVYNDLCEGKTLVQAHSGQTAVFPKLYVDMVRTAETGGSLDETLNQAADYQEMSLEMRRKVGGALTYPAILMVVALGVVLFMMVYLLPQFADMFSRMQTEIPLSTRFLMGASAFLRENWWAIPIAIFGGYAGFKAIVRVPAGKLAVTRLIHHIPVFGDLTKKIVLARLLRALGTLSGAGVSLLIALETAQQTAQDVLFEQAMIQIRQAVEEGESLSEAVIGTHVFPAMICQMIAVGEKSGRLSSVLLRIAVFYERDIEARLKVLTAVIEPIMIVVLGVLVGFIAVSIITPIYSLVGSVK